MRFKTLASFALTALSAWSVAHADPLSTSQLNSLETTPPSRGKLVGSWKFELGGETYSEGQDEGAAAILRAGVQADYRFAPWLNAHVEPVVELFSSRLQERFDNDAYENHLRADAMYLQVDPASFAALRVGAIGQRYLDNPILISGRRAFPGTQEIIAAESRHFKVNLMAQQVVPTSFTLNTERESKEPLPLFQTQSLSFEGRSKVWGWSLTGGHYQYSRLPDKVAFQSGRAGNTVIGGEVAPGARLAYGFDGVFWGAHGCMCGDAPVQFELSYYGQHNTAAPSDSADAQYFELGPHFRFGDQELSLSYFNYFIESDAAVARYARSSLGYTNRVGDGIILKYFFKDRGFNVHGGWVNARTIAENQTQRTFSEIHLGVETEYAPF